MKWYGWAWVLLWEVAACCTGEESSRQMGERIRAVEQVRDELRREGK